MYFPLSLNSIPRGAVKPSPEAYWQNWQSAESLPLRTYPPTVEM
jgi:hypothetical protein